jgi:hypothetical protein
MTGDQVLKQFSHSFLKLFHLALIHHAIPLHITVGSYSCSHDQCGCYYSVHAPHLVPKLVEPESSPEFGELHPVHAVFLVEKIIKGA